MAPLCSRPEGGMTVPEGAHVGERKITYDARGLAEPFADIPKISEIDGTRARFDAQELTTRRDRPTVEHPKKHREAFALADASGYLCESHDARSNRRIGGNCNARKRIGARATSNAIFSIVKFTAK